MATLSYAYGDGVVWLEELAAEAHPMVHDLCRAHAENVRVPRGWQLRDRWRADVEDPDIDRTGPCAGDQGRFDLVGA